MKKLTRAKLQEHFKRKGDYDQLPDMRLKQLAVGKIKEAGRALRRAAGGAQVFQVGRYVRLKGRVIQRVLLVADIADACLVWFGLREKI